MGVYTELNKDLTSNPQYSDPNYLMSNSVMNATPKQDIYLTNARKPLGKAAGEEEMQSKINAINDPKLREALMLKTEQLPNLAKDLRNYQAKITNKFASSWKDNTFDPAKVLIDANFKLQNVSQDKNAQNDFLDQEAESLVSKYGDKDIKWDDIKAVLGDSADDYANKMAQYRNIMTELNSNLYTRGENEAQTSPTNVTPEDIKGELWGYRNMLTPIARDVINNDPGNNSRYGYLENLYNASNVKSKSEFYKMDPQRGFDAWANITSGKASNLDQFGSSMMDMAIILNKLDPSKVEDLINPTEKYAKSIKQDYNYSEIPDEYVKRKQQEIYGETPMQEIYKIPNTKNYQSPKGVIKYDELSGKYEVPEGVKFFIQPQSGKGFYGEIKQKENINPREIFYDQ